MNDLDDKDKNFIDYFLQKSGWAEGVFANVFTVNDIKQRVSKKIGVLASSFIINLHVYSKSPGFINTLLENKLLDDSFENSFSFPSPVIISDDDKFVHGIRVDQFDFADDLIDYIFSNIIIPNNNRILLSNALYAAIFNYKDIYDYLADSIFKKGQ